MNKQIIIKWCKRIGIAIVSAAAILLLYGISCDLYRQYYIPYYYKSLYKEGLIETVKADSIALILFEHGYIYNGDMYNKESAVKLLLNAANKGNINAQVLLGRYYKGYPIAVGYNKDWSNRWQQEEYLIASTYWYLQAAQQGNAEAQGELGHNYKYGIGVKQDFKKAIYWIKKGADGGNPVAQWRMGELYFNGLALYDIDFLHKGYTYVGDGDFWSKDGESYNVKNSDLDSILCHPYNVYLKPDLKKAKYYWTLSAKQDFEQAKYSLIKLQ